MAVEQCKNCRFYMVRSDDNMDGWSGYCRWFPPVFKEDRALNDGWLNVHGQSWCGEFEDDTGGAIMTALRDPELDGLMTQVVLCREYEDTNEGYQAMERVIDALNQHPYFKAKRKAALDELAAFSQEFEDDTGGSGHDTAI